MPKRSTGPRTPPGKTKVSMNAMKHGLTARDVVLPGENPEDLDSFRAELVKSLDPQGALECELVETIVMIFWRLRRIPKFEALLYEHGSAKLRVGRAEKLVTQYESTAEGPRAVVA